MDAIDCGVGELEDGSVRVTLMAERGGWGGHDAEVPTAGRIIHTYVFSVNATRAAVVGELKDFLSAMGYPLPYGSLRVVEDDAA